MSIAGSLATTTIKEVNEGFRLSPQQKRLWLLGEGQSYRAQYTMALEGRLNRDFLKSALRSVTERHEILRTYFYRLPGMNLPVQVIAEEPAFLYEEIDLSGYEPSDQEFKIRQALEEWGNLPFDYTRLPLVRFVLLKLSDSKHLLFISLPALCADVVTLRNLVTEIGNAYIECQDPQKPADEPLQYADLAEWQNELLESGAAETGQNFWRKQDPASAFTVMLPGEARLAEKHGFDPQFHAFKLPLKTLAEAEGTSKESGVSLAQFLLTCWQTLLWRLTGRQDVIIGVESDCRKYQELGNALGPLTQYIPFHYRIDGDVSFRETLSRAAESRREAQKWDAYFSWESVARNDNSVEEGAYFPLSFDFSEQVSSHSGAGITFTLDDEYVCADRFKLKLLCRRSSDQLLAELHYDANLFSSEDIRRLASQCQQLLESAARFPDMAIGELPILNEADLRQILVGFNQTDAGYEANVCLHQLFERQAASTPNQIAVISDVGQVNYRELNARANRLARHLRSQSISPGDRVGLCVERSVEMVVGALGILKAGCAYVPIDPALPKARLSFMLRDAQISLLLIQQEHSQHLPAHQARVICLDGDWETIAEENDENQGMEVASESPAYIIYTSGSTGKPKGVVISHRAIVNRILWGQSIYPLNGTDRVLQSAALGFDFSVWEIFAPLTTGASVVLPRPGGQYDMAYLVELIANQQVTTAHFVPTVFKLFLDEKGIANCRSLRRIFCGGESLPIALKERFFEALDVDLFNQYGPTEATVDATFHLCERDNFARSVPIGRPIANTQIYILDHRLQPVPIGVTGELYIGGTGLAQGYLNRPDLTAERFIPDPFGNKKGERLYKTGDLASYLPNGDIEFLGRGDYQVKLRGLRIELGEIEAWLSEHPAVNEALVAVHEAATDDARLVAYVTLRQEQAPAPGELNEFLKERGPEFMVPSEFVILNNFPLLPSGKIDRQALPAPCQARTDQSEKFIAPRTPIENGLARIWARVLRVERVGVQDNFFDLGGHSLLAMQMISRAREAFQLELPLRLFFDAPVIEKLALVVEDLLIKKIEDIPEEEAQHLLTLIGAEAASVGA